MQPGENESGERKLLVAIYVRVSSKDQAEHGYSLEQQVNILKDECVKRGWRYVYVYKEGGETGENTERPKFQRMLMMAERKKFDIVLVWKLDRLGRSNIDLQYIREYFRILGIDIVSYTEPFDSTTLSGKLLFDMLASLAEWERGNIIERSKLGLRGRALEGKWKGGSPPYGYKYNRETGFLEIEEDEAQVVRLIFEKFIELEGLQAVRRHLKKHGYKTRREKWFQKQQISNMLSNERYTGWKFFMDIRAHDPELAIIDEGTFEKAQEVKRRIGKCFLARRTRKKAQDEAEPCPWCGHRASILNAYCPNCGAGLWVADGVL